MAQYHLIDVLGKEQGVFLVAQQAETPSPATIRQQVVFAASPASRRGKTAVRNAAVHLCAAQRPNIFMPLHLEAPFGELDDGVRCQLCKIRFSIVKTP
jgi:hypothetical protein